MFCITSPAYRLDVGASMPEHSGNHMRPSLSRPLLARALALFALSLCAVSSAAQVKVLGAQDCEKCHKPALKKWRVEEPAQYGPKAHANTHKQLLDPKAAAYAKVIGLANPSDPAGRCAQCHATVVRGLVRSGVSCETCHGAGSGYLQVHDKEPYAESYKKSLPLGLVDLHNKPAAIARLCVDCHVTPEKALAAAGHPNGADFDVAAGLKKLVHWTAEFTPDNTVHATYDFAQVAAAARPLVQKALAGGGGAARPPAAPGPKGTAPVPGGSLASAPSVAPRAAAPASLFDDGVPVLQCPPDCPSDAPVPVAPAAAPSIRRPPRSIVVDAPALPQPALEPATPAAPPAPAGIAASRPRSAAADLAALKGRAADTLARLLASGQRAPSLPPPGPPQEYRGPDGELLNIQDLALYLALDALRKPKE